MTHPGKSQDLVQQARQLLASLDHGAMSIAAYDTAWIARLPEADHPDRPAFPESLAWLCAHQHADGSWGGPVPLLPRPYHLDAGNPAQPDALAQCQREQRMLRARRCAILANGVNLPHDPYETVGFELIIPTLMEEAQRGQLRLPYDYFDKYNHIRAQKLARIPAKWLYTRQNPAPIPWSLWATTSSAIWRPHIQEENGSVGDSPVGTAYFLMACGEEPRARQYIAQVMAGHEAAARLFLSPGDIRARLGAL